MSFTFFCVSLLTAMFPISPSAARGFSEGPVTEQAFPPRSVLVEAKRFCREIQIFSHTSYKSMLLVYIKGLAMSPQFAFLQRNAREQSPQRRTRALNTAGILTK